ncbi:hypothetical protein CISG_00522 [Coccidioides immitis RMSCC 3703]|uniref:Uncharacterized protein n=1 Tax=Coccidioides immitis RMSCC 3703 TaxID=454286 RepID=A0A0J8QLY4_COCIT|nr:hypothetical protein CISG_00522 [Coccidioides immitis RMSCC 3703]
MTSFSYPEFGLQLFFWGRSSLICWRSFTQNDLVGGLLTGTLVQGPACPASGAFWVCVESFLGLLRDLDGKFPTVLVPIRAGLVPTPCLDDVLLESDAKFN